MFYHACFTMQMHISAAIRLVIIPPIQKNFHCLTPVLFVTFVTANEIGQVLVNTAKLMVYSIGFSCNIAIESVRLINVCTNMETCSITFVQFYIVIRNGKRKFGNTGRPRKTQHVMLEFGKWPKTPGIILA